MNNQSEGYHPEVENEELLNQIRAAKDMSEVAAAFRGAGIQVTEEELLSGLNAPEGELTEEDLEEAAGGRCFIFMQPLIVFAMMEVIDRILKLNQSKEKDQTRGHSGSGRHG